MNPNKVEQLTFHHYSDQIEDSHPLIFDVHHQDDQPPPSSEFSLPSLPDFVLFQDEDEEDSVSHTSSDADGVSGPSNNEALSIEKSQKPNPRFQFINPDPHISSQFYTFNIESHSLMIRCILERRLASSDEIRAATPQSVLSSWRSVWKDRNEDTAYLTAWKRIQDKLTVYVDQNGNEFLCFKNNSSNQFVSYVSQWQDIVMRYHGDADLKHLGLRDTIERIKQAWTVGAKFYGIPESYIRVCVAACPVCSDSSGSGARSKRRRFEYTESFDVPAKEVANKLQQLAAKHKVVLCIRQKYIRYKPFMAEVKDYACHRAGEPTSSKKLKIVKREPYTSKRCGCGFRIRAIVPISNYNEKDKTFVYQEEGMAVFKLYAVHTGHEPGPSDGSARIMHRVVGLKGGFLIDDDMIYEEADHTGLAFTGKDDGVVQHSVLQQVKELRNEIVLLEGKITRIPQELLGSVSQELFDVLNKVRSIGEYGSKSKSGDVLVGENDLADWTHHQRIYEDAKDAELIEEDDDSFGRTLGNVASWNLIRSDCRNEKDLLGETCKPEKWLKCNDFDEKSLKPVRHDEGMETDSLVSLQVDSFYPENPKWYDSPHGLDPETKSW